MTFKPVRKAVLPVAGLGTRFLPATKAMPKEMLTVVDKPLIQYAVEEALEAGIEQIIFVTGRNKSALEDHFDISYELEDTMRARVIGALEVADSETDKYGIISPGKVDGRLTEVTALVEKPARGTAPSNLMIPGRYILQPEVMRILETQEKGAGGEIQLTDAMAQLIGRQPFHGYTFDGARYDCGDKAGYIQANLALALQREDIGPVVRDFARALLN